MKLLPGKPSLLKRFVELVTEVGNKFIANNLNKFIRRNKLCKTVKHRFLRPFCFHRLFLLVLIGDVSTSGRVRESLKAKIRIYDDINLCQMDAMLNMSILTSEAPSDEDCDSGE